MADIKVRCNIAVDKRCEFSGDCSHRYFHKQGLLGLSSCTEEGHDCMYNKSSIKRKCIVDSSYYNESCFEENKE